MFEDLIESTTIVTNVFGLTFDIGGGSATPRVELVCTAAHLEIPQHATDDIIGLDVNFHALGATIDATDELTIKYVGTA